MTREPPAPTGLPESAPAAPPASGDPPPAEAITCPLCEYDLRGLAEPRCPECGFAFSWDEIRDPARRKHPWLFEHHGTVRSLVRTLLGGLRPTRFWRQLHPGQASRPRRLLVYFLLVCASALLPAGVNAVRGDVRMQRQVEAFRAQRLQYLQSPQGQAMRARTSTLTPQQIVDVQFPQLSLRSRLRIAVLSNGGASLVAGAAYVAWVVLTLAAFLIFRFSLRRARLRSSSR